MAGECGSALACRITEALPIEGRPPASMIMITREWRLRPAAPATFWRDDPATSRWRSPWTSPPGPGANQGGLIKAAEVKLGRHLPESYVELLTVKNGGRPVRRCIQTTFRTSWAKDHIEISAIRGIGGTWGIDSDGPLSSGALIAEWGYPDIGIVICDMPSGGHDIIMLDYSDGDGEPSVAYIDEDRRPQRIANSFSEFLNLLRRCEEISR